MIQECIAKLVEGKNLSEAEAKAAFDEIMRGEATPAQISAFLIGLRVKGETPGEIAAGVKSMQAVMSAVKPKVKGKLLDTCGTGGDKLNTFNISTAAAFVAAGAGCIVAKHGNRAVSSGSGSADVLEKLGVKVDLPAEKVAGIIEKVGIGFLFAPCCHQAMKHAMPVRKELGVRTIFNILGPLVNPANAETRLVGVYSIEMAEKIAKALQLVKVEKALVANGASGKMDELSTLEGENIVFEVAGGKIRKYSIDAAEFGFRKASLGELQVKNADESAAVIRGLLEGREKGAKKEIVLLNAGAAIYANGKTKTIAKGIKAAEKSIDSGAALKKLEQLKGASNK
ncbi:MAG: anthranilate phosphoribosyltransferase [Candidatus Diapherotrites archaeon]